MVLASPMAGVGLSGSSLRVGSCACLKRECSGEPDAGNPHLRFDEGRVGRGLAAFSPTLPVAQKTLSLSGLDLAAATEPDLLLLARFHHWGCADLSLMMSYVGVPRECHE